MVRSMVKSKVRFRVKIVVKIMDRSKVMSVVRYLRSKLRLGLLSHFMLF